MDTIRVGSDTDPRGIAAWAVPVAAGVAVLASTAVLGALLARFLTDVPTLGAAAALSAGVVLGVLTIRARSRVLPSVERLPADLRWTGKRMCDLLLAGFLVLVTVPVWLVVAIAIKLDSPGPVFFTQERVGRRGRPFRILKFRSMVSGAESLLDKLAACNQAAPPYFKVRTDPRVTRVGRWLRRLSIDELPQLVNVLRGEMSLVGPRPPLATEVSDYPSWACRRFDAQPGITGLWQVSGRFLLPFDEGARLDLFYLEHRSWKLDLKIMAQTLWVMICGRGSC